LDGGRGHRRLSWATTLLSFFQTGQICASYRRFVSRLGTIDGTKIGSSSFPRLSVRVPKEGCQANSAGDGDPAAPKGHRQLAG